MKTSSPMLITRIRNSLLEYLLENKLAMNVHLPLDIRFGIVEQINERMNSIVGSVEDETSPLHVVVKMLENDETTAQELLSELPIKHKSCDVLKAFIAGNDSTMVDNIEIELGHFLEMNGGDLELYSIVLDKERDVTEVLDHLTDRHLDGSVDEPILLQLACAAYVRRLSYIVNDMKVPFFCNTGVGSFVDYRTDDSVISVYPLIDTIIPIGSGYGAEIHDAMDRLNLIFLSAKNVLEVEEMSEAEPEVSKEPQYASLSQHKEMMDRAIETSWLNIATEVNKHLNDILGSNLPIDTKRSLFREKMVTLGFEARHGIMSKR